VSLICTLFMTYVLTVNKKSKQWMLLRVIAQSVVQVKLRFATATCRPALLPPALVSSSSTSCSSDGPASPFSTLSWSSWSMQTLCSMQYDHLRHWVQMTRVDICQPPEPAFTFSQNTAKWALISLLVTSGRLHNIFLQSVNVRREVLHGFFHTSGPRFQPVVDCAELPRLLPLDTPWLRTCRRIPVRFHIVSAAYLWDTSLTAFCPSDVVGSALCTLLTSDGEQSYVTPKPPQFCATPSAVATGCRRSHTTLSVMPLWSYSKTMREEPPVLLLAAVVERYVLPRTRRSRLMQSCPTRVRPTWALVT